MNQLWTALIHAGVGGFVGGFLPIFAGANWKQALIAGAGSALTSVLSLFSPVPTKNS